MSKRFHALIGALTLTVAAFSPAAHADDWKPQDFPAGIDIWAKGGLVVREGEKGPKGNYPDNPVPIFDKDGKLTPVGQYVDDLARDPQKLIQHFDFALSDKSGHWLKIDNRKFKGTAMDMPAQSCIHRTLGTIGGYRNMITLSKSVPAEFKTGLADMNNKGPKYFPPLKQWTEPVEKYLNSIINEDGLFAKGDNVCDLAQSFHMIRTAIGGSGLDVLNVYTLPKAQALVKSILTKPYLFQPDDEWVTANADDLAKFKPSDTMPEVDPWIKDGKRFFAAGTFTGWKNVEHPSLHGTWDALAIINQLYRRYPEPDPTKETSIFYAWYKLPEEQRALAQRGLTALKRKIWLDYAEKKGPSYCYIVNGKPIDSKEIVALGDAAKPEVPLLNDGAGYKVNDRCHWAYLCYQELFNPIQPSEKDPTNLADGMNALFATWEKNKK